MNGEALKPMKPQKSLMESLLEFDWKAATVLIGILGMAGLFYLGHFFITKEQYDTDKNHMNEIINFRFDQVQKSQEETKKDVKEILHEQRKANK